MLHLLPPEHQHCPEHQLGRGGDGGGGGVDTCIGVAIAANTYSSGTARFTCSLCKKYSL